MENQNIPAQAPGTQLQRQEPAQMMSPSQLFTSDILKEFASTNGPIELTSYQRKLIQNYFIKIDMVLQEAERKRLGKSEQYREPLPYYWSNVNLPKLAVDVITFSSVGLDPAQDNHINPIPYKNNKSDKYDITFIIGYKGVALKAKKYGADIPDEVTVELVYKNDQFKALKKDKNNPVESYEFEIADSFDRGELIGGFYYHGYSDNPHKNKLKTFSKADIEKRKPKNASAEFWGGEKDKYVNGKKEGKEQVEGWYDEMAYKTIYRAAFNSIVIDSEKIDEHYLAVIERERDNRDFIVTHEIESKSNKKEVGFDSETGEVFESQPKQLPASESVQMPAQAFTTSVQQQAQPVMQQQAPHSVDRQKANAPF